MTSTYYGAAEPRDRTRTAEAKSLSRARRAQRLAKLWSL